MLTFLLLGIAQFSAKDRCVPDLRLPIRTHSPPPITSHRGAYGVPVFLLTPLLPCDHVMLTAFPLLYLYSVTKAGGALGIITAFIAFYTGLSELLAGEERRIVGLPLGIF